VITAFGFVAFAAAGALCRAECGRRLNRHDGFAWGTLLVNVSGSFVLGAIHDISPPALTVLGVGGLGAFTTFSSFARDAVALAELRRTVLSAAYIGATLVLGVIAAAIGMRLS
jgi:fluoride exporter